MYKTFNDAMLTRVANLFNRNCQPVYTWLQWKRQCFIATMICVSQNEFLGWKNYYLSSRMQPYIPLSQHELTTMRSDLRQGILGIGIVLILGLAFTWLFSANVPQDSIVGQLFGWSPLIGAGSVSVFLLYHLWNSWRDIQASQKVLVTGTITKKYTRITPSSTGSTLVRLSERTRHYIFVEGKRFLIKGHEYGNCNVGTQVRMYVTPYGQKVLDLEYRA